MADLPLPERSACERTLAQMLLIRRFEERAGEMYAKAKIGGFLHLCIGEEATIVGATEALRDTDYLLSTYREHGQALARGTSPDAVMAELFGKRDGCSGGRGGSMHLFDVERRLPRRLRDRRRQPAARRRRRARVRLRGRPTTRRSACSATARPTRAPSARR